MILLTITPQLSKLFLKTYRKNQTIAGTVFSLLFLSFVVPQSVPKLDPIVLHRQLLPINPKEFYIAQVSDERADKSAIAWVFPLVVPKQKLVIQAVDFKGGGLTTLQDFIFQSLPRNNKLRPIVLRVKECNVTESLTTPGRIEGKVAFAVSFDLLADPENIHLTDYRIDTKYIRSDNQQNLAAPALQESLSLALKFLNTWMDDQANHNPKLAKEVKVFFKDYHEKLEGDTIYYSNNRPLNWNDFQEKPHSSKYAASVFPSFGFEEQREVVNGAINLHLDMKVYVPKSGCWVKDGDRNDYTLNHEQRHFDVVKIVAAKFERKILALKLPVSNCDGLINFEYYESFREMNHLQDQYDDETQHGINKSKQEEWNIYIDKELSKFGIVKPAL